MLWEWNWQNVRSRADLWRGSKMVKRNLNRILVRSHPCFLGGRMQRAGVTTMLLGLSHSRQQLSTYWARDFQPQALKCRAEWKKTAILCFLSSFLILFTHTIFSLVSLTSWDRNTDTGMWTHTSHTWFRSAFVSCGIWSWNILPLHSVPWSIIGILLESLSFHMLSSCCLQNGIEVHIS